MLLGSITELGSITQLGSIILLATMMGGVTVCDNGDLLQVDGHMDMLQVAVRHATVPS